MIRMPRQFECPEQLVKFFTLGELVAGRNRTNQTKQNELLVCGTRMLYVPFFKLLQKAA